MALIHDSRVAVVIAGLVVSYTCYRCYIWPRLLSPYRQLPGPKDTLIPWGHASALISAPIGAQLLEWVNTIPNDGIVVLRSFSQHYLLPTSPAMLRTILNDNVYDWQKPAALKTFLEPILGTGLVLAEGTVHRSQRKRLLPAFAIPVIRDLYPLFWTAGQRMASLLPIGARIEFDAWAARATLDIIGLAGFGTNFETLENGSSEIMECYQRTLDSRPLNVAHVVLSKILPGQLVDILLPKKSRQVRNDMALLRRYATDMVRESKPSGVNILSQIKKNGDVSEEEIVDQILTMLAAGHETTAAALTWAVSLLAVHTDTQSSLRKEIREHIRSKNDQVDYPLIDSLPLLNAVCNETLRLYPIAPAVVRTAICDTVLGKVAVRKGTSVALSPWAINRSRQFWGEDAEEFTPDRWMQPGASKSGGASTNYALLTFLQGPRSCIGRDFAMGEFKCLLAALIRRHTVILDMPEADIVPAGLITLKPRNGLYIRLEAVDDD